MEIKKPAKMLPRAKRLIGFRRLGLFSLIVMRDRYRGAPSEEK